MILDLRRSVISHRNRANAKHARGDHDNRSPGATSCTRYERCVRHVYHVSTVCAVFHVCLITSLFTRLLAKFL